MHPAALLEGPNVRLDLLTEDDADALMRWERDSASTRLHLSNAVTPSSRAAWVRRIEAMNTDSRAFPFGIRRRDTDELVGEVSLDGVSWTHRHAGMGISLAAEHQGKGIGTEAIGLVLAFVFDELNLHRLELGVFSYNGRALALYRRLGFVDEGRGVEWGRRDGAWFDLVHLALLEPAWRRSQERSE